MSAHEHSFPNWFGRVRNYSDRGFITPIWWFRGNVQPDDAAEPQTFTQVAAASIEKSPKKTELAGAEEPLDGIATGIDYPPLDVSPRTASSVEQTRPERDAEKSAFKNGKPSFARWLNF